MWKIRAWLKSELGRDFLLTPPHAAPAEHLNKIPFFPHPCPYTELFTGVLHLRYLYWLYTGWAAAPGSQLQPGVCVHGVAPRGASCCRRLRPLMRHAHTVLFLFPSIPLRPRETDYAAALLLWWATTTRGRGIKAPSPPHTHTHTPLVEFLLSDPFNWRFVSIPGKRTALLMLVNKTLTGSAITTTAVWSQWSEESWVNIVGCIWTGAFCSLLHTQTELHAFNMYFWRLCWG